MNTGDLVPGGGIEPPQGFWPLRILSPLRLPISPSRLRNDSSLAACEYDDFCIVGNHQPIDHSTPESARRLPAHLTLVELPNEAEFPWRMPTASTQLKSSQFFKSIYAWAAAEVKLGAATVPARCRRSAS
jgi:hypothetical protein